MLGTAVGIVCSFSEAEIIQWVFFFFGIQKSKGSPNNQEFFMRKSLDGFFFVIKKTHVMVLV